MGMSASQARLLSLTSRLSDLELKAQSISNSKIRLADASSEASRQYQDALDKQKVTLYNSETNSHVNATANNLTSYNPTALGKQRFLVDNLGQIIVSKQIGDAYTASNGDFETFLHKLGYTPQSTASIKQASATNLVTALVSDINIVNAAMVGRETVFSTSMDQNTINTRLAAIRNDLSSISATFSGADLGTYLSSISVPAVDVNNSASISALRAALLNISGAKISDCLSKANPNSSTPVGQTLAQRMSVNDAYTYDNGAITYYANIFDQISQHGGNIQNDENMNNTDWLYQQFNSGNIYLVEQKDSDSDGDGEKDWERIPWKTGDSAIQLQTDESEVAKAEAEYEVVTKEIEAKDKRFDLELKNIDTEHNAIQNEMDSVKKVIEKNIERSFKVFNG